MTGCAAPGRRSSRLNAESATLDEPGDRLDRPACREDVVVDDHPGALLDRSGVHLERVLPVLEQVAGAHGLGRELAGPPRRDEPAAHLARDRRPEDEAPRLGAEY